jgi:Tfp pilus assembly protein PilO
MLLGIVFIVGSVVIYFQLIQPSYDEMLALKSDDASRQKFLDDEKSAVDKVKGLIADYHDTKNEEIQKTVSLVLPTEPDGPGAIAQLYGLTQKNNLQLTGISISGAGVSGASAVSGLKPSNLKAALQRPLGTLSLSTTLTGSYEDFKTFLSELQTNIRIFDLKSLTVAPIFKAGKDKNVQEISGYTFGIAVSTYYQTP